MPEKAIAAPQDAARCELLIWGLRRTMRGRGPAKDGKNAENPAF